MRRPRAEMCADGFRDEAQRICEEEKATVADPPESFIDTGKQWMGGEIIELASFTFGDGIVSCDCNAPHSLSTFLPGGGTATSSRNALFPRIWRPALSCSSTNLLNSTLQSPPNSRLNRLFLVFYLNKENKGMRLANYQHRDTYRRSGTREFNIEVRR